MSKPGKVLKALCKKLGVRLTVKRGKKRIYKSVALLKAQCKRRKKVKKRRRKFGTIRMVPVNPRDTQRGSHYIVTKNNGQEISGQIMYYQGPNNHLNYDNNEQDERAFILVKVTEDIGPFFHRIFADEIDRIEKVDFPLLPEALVKKIQDY